VPVIVIARKIVLPRCTCHDESGHLRGWTCLAVPSVESGATAFGKVGPVGRACRRFETAAKTTTNCAGFLLAARLEPRHLNFRN
jgi:hypothetical protein